MAGPPPANLSLQDRLIRLAQTLQFAWFVGHVSLLLAALRYALSYLTFNYYSRWAKFSYRTAFVAAGVTYGIVVYKGFRARTRQGKPTTPLALLGDENVQYLGKLEYIEFVGIRRLFRERARFCLRSKVSSSTVGKCLLKSNNHGIDDLS